MEQNNLRRSQRIRNRNRDGNTPVSGPETRRNRQPRRNNGQTTNQAVTNRQTIINDNNIHDLVKKYIEQRHRLPEDLLNKPIGDWDVSRVTDMGGLFSQYIEFNEPIGNWDVSNVINMRSMFGSWQWSNNFNQPLDNWNVSNVENMGGMFYNAENFNQPLNSWNVSNVEKMDGMFYNARNFNQPLNNWDVSNVKDMHNMFINAINFNQPLNNWDVSNVKKMDGMFNDAKIFNQPLNNWNVSNVTQMDNMFCNAENFNQPLDSWNVSNVIDTSFMFDGAKSFNQPLNNWNVSNVDDMTSMFNNATNFNQPLNNWDVSNVNAMSNMFNNAVNFNQPLNSWDVSNVEYMHNMFDGALNFNQPLNNWNVQNVRYAASMFERATSFTNSESLNNWNFMPNADIDNMFLDSGVTVYPPWYNNNDSDTDTDDNNDNDDVDSEVSTEIDENEITTEDVNINQMAFNFVTQEELTIKDFLQENSDNIVFVVNNKPYLLNRNEIRNQVLNNNNNKYGCKRAGYGSSFTLDSNIKFTPVYFSLSSIIGLQIVVTKNSVETLLNDPHNIYICYDTGIILPAVMSVAYYNGSGGVSADHCQPDQNKLDYKTYVYKLVKAIPTEEPITQLDKRKFSSLEQEQSIKVQYKGFIYDFPVTLETTLNNVKELLLNKLIEENKIQNNNYNVKFIYTGRMYKDNELNKLLTELQNPPYGITLQSMVSPISGGRLTKRRLTRKRKTKRRNLTKKYNKSKKRKQTKRKNKLTKRKLKYNKSKKHNK